MTKTATFAAGCFWGVEETFLQTPGVLKTEVGYSGGSAKDPTYELVCTGTTGHAEAVQVMYDSEKVSYNDLLKIFFENHNPTTLNAQGPDIGEQYRSVIFFHSPEQEKQAKEYVEELTRSGKFPARPAGGKRPIVTQIIPAAPFYKAEEYHQQYLKKRGLRSCHV